MSSMAQDGDNDNDAYYLPIQIILVVSTVEPNKYLQASSIAHGI